MKQYRIEGVAFSEYGNRRYCTICHCGVEATYPFDTPKTRFPIKALLMDLDGTTVRSEEFWIYLTECTMKRLLRDESFRLSEEDLPYVSGFSTAEHLSYCLKKYGCGCTVGKALDAYHMIAKAELEAILHGRGKANAFRPREGLKEFLLAVKSAGIRIGLATSGLEYKAIPEIVSVFCQLGMGDPSAFYDAIITGGKRKEKGEYGSIGEAAAKPHPWIYSELAAGIGVDREETLVLEDSSAGLLAGRLAGMNVIGFTDGNLIRSGFAEECCAMAETFNDVLRVLRLD